MVTGHLREQNGYFQMILTWKDSTGKRRSKSVSTGLPVKGNKKRAEKMLLKARSEFNPDNCEAVKGMPFTDFLSKWLVDRAGDIPPEEYSNFAYYVKTNISPYFSSHNKNVIEISADELISYYEMERNQNGTGNRTLLSLSRTISNALDYAVLIGWRTDNPAQNVNPCVLNSTPLFTEFLVEWLKIEKTQIAVFVHCLLLSRLRRSYSRRKQNRKQIESFAVTAIAKIILVIFL